MRNPTWFSTAASLLLLPGCGLENFFSNTAHDAYDRPSSALVGKTSWAGQPTDVFSAVDGDGNVIRPFLVNPTSGAYEMRLPSAKYAMLRAQSRAGNLLVRALVPKIGEETRLTGVDLDERYMTEALIVEARLGATGLKLKQLTPDAYLGTRAQIFAAMDKPGPTQELMKMVQKFLQQTDATSGTADPDFFALPELDATYKVKTSPINRSYLLRNPLDYTGSGHRESDSVLFDAKLAEAAKLFDPTGCPDPKNLRVLFTVDFNKGALNGNCGSGDRFLWATDKPGKSMFFVGWVHKESVLQDPGVNALLGSSTPNQLPMYDDGTNGDEVAGDGIWTIGFVLPKGNPATGEVYRVGYKYTWGTRGAQWTGTEEWPGNSRILEAVDVNGDDIVYRRDVFGDEATNKDRSNLSTSPLNTGTVNWTTDLRGCGAEAREQMVSPGVNDKGNPVTPTNACKCETWVTPKSVGPLKVACP